MQCRPCSCPNSVPSSARWRPRCRTCPRRQSQSCSRCSRNDSGCRVRQRARRELVLRRVCRAGDVCALQIRIALDVDVEPTSPGLNPRLLNHTCVVAASVTARIAEAPRRATHARAEPATHTLLMCRTLARVLHAGDVQIAAADRRVYRSAVVPIRRRVPRSLAKHHCSHTRLTNINFIASTVRVEIIIPLKPK